MKKLTVLNKSILTALSVALCVVLPMTLHAIPKGGVLFSPMHLPVLLCGLVCGAPFGLICGILGPFVSSMLTSMPAFGYMPIMMIELGLYGLRSTFRSGLRHSRTSGIQSAYRYARFRIYACHDDRAGALWSDQRSGHAVSSQR